MTDAKPVVVQADRDFRSVILKHIADSLDRPCTDGDMIEDRQDALDLIIARHRHQSTAPYIAALRRAYELASKSSTLDWSEDRNVMLAVHLAGDIRNLLAEHGGEVGPWRDIESAPELTEIDVWIDGLDDTGWRVTGEIMSKQEPLWLKVNGENYFPHENGGYPTHWMPLPPPPVAQRDKAGEA